MEAALLYIAARLAHNELGEAHPASRRQIAPVAWEITGLAERCLPEIIQEAKMNLLSVARMFGPAAVSVWAVAICACSVFTQFLPSFLAA